MSTAPPASVADALTALGPAGRRRAAAAATAKVAADVSGTVPRLDPVPVVLDEATWEELSTGLVQRARLLDALYADLYGPRTVFQGDVAPIASLLADPAYLRPAIGLPSRGPHHLFAVACTLERTTGGDWQVIEDVVDVPGGAGTALEVRRALSRSAPSLYGAMPLRRLTPYFDTVRTALHHRARTDGRAGRAVVIAEGGDPLRAFDQHWLANLLGAPVVSASDLSTGSGALTLRLPGVDPDPGDAVDALVRLVPSGTLDPLDLGPTPRGVTGLVEAARCGDVEILNPPGSGLLENAALRAALPDLCRQMLHEDLLLRSPDADRDPGEGTPGTWPSLDPAGGDDLVDRPVRVQLLVMAGEDGFEVMPGGIGRTVDDGEPLLKDVWVAVPETSAPTAPASAADGSAPAATTSPASPSPDEREVLTAYPAMTRSIGSDLFWFGRYLERVDSTARLLRTVLDSTNDLAAESGPAPRTALAVLLGAVTDVTTTYPGFHDIDLHDPAAVRVEIAGLLTDVGRPGSLAQSFTALAHTTRGLRDLVSDSVWPSIARMRDRVRHLGGDQPLEHGLSDMVDGCLALSGAIADSMPRNLGWDLTETGRRLERALGLLALLQAALGRRRTRAAETRIAGAVVAITESGATYRRTYQAAVQSELLLEMLLEDTSLPRSLAFQLDRLGSALDRLPEPTPSVELRAPLASLRSRVATWEPRALLRPEGPAVGSPTPLIEEAAGAMDTLRELATAIENRYFRPSEATSPWGVDDV